MKKIIILLAALAISAPITSCSDFLDVESPSNITEKSQFDTVEESFSALTSVYNQLAGDDAYGQRLSLYYGMSGDDFKTGGDYNCNDRRAIGFYNVCDTNTELDKPFLRLFAGIERANIVIKNIPLSPLMSSGTDSEKALMKRFLGEALTLRAFFYFEAIKNWGDVPFQTVPSADLDNLYLAKTDRDIIYDQIIEDLKVAQEYIPWKSEDPTSSSSRLTKAAAKGLRARIALFRGGYSLRKDSKMMERRSDYKAFYQIAYDETKEIIAKGDHAINPKYENVFRALHTNVDDDSREVIFAVGAFGSGSRVDSKIGYYNGLRADNSSQYRGGGGILALPVYFYDFNKYDLRRDVNVGIFAIDANDRAILASGKNWTDAKWRKGWSNVRGASVQYTGVDWPVLRYSDVLLMFAEADNEINNAPSPEAINALRTVQTRAYTGHLEQLPAIPTDKTGFFNALVKERYLEFGSEGLRKFDLIRWNLLAAKILETKQKLRDFINGTGAYANVPSDIYYKASPYDPAKTAQQNISDIEIYHAGIDKEDVFYTPLLSTSTPSGYSKIKWRSDLTIADYIDDPVKGYAHYFEENKKELLPIFRGILNTNYNLTQDFGN